MRIPAKGGRRAHVPILFFAAISPLMPPPMMMWSTLFIVNFFRRIYPSTGTSCNSPLRTRRFAAFSCGSGFWDERQCAHRAPGALQDLKRSGEQDRALGRQLVQIAEASEAISVSLGYLAV